MAKDFKGQEVADPLLSVVCACYNENDCLSELYRRVSAACRSAVGDDYEFILVDDGSSDATWGVITQLASEDPHVVGVALSRNFGHQAALSAGLEICSGKRVLSIDADLQDPPELIPEMMRLMDQGCDVVHGQRVKRLGESVFKKTSAILFYRVLKRLAAVDIVRDSADFRLMSRRCVNALLSMQERQRYLRGMVSWAGFRQESLFYERQARHAGVTKYPIRKMIVFATDAITSFSIFPLRLASYLGALLVIVAFGVMIYVLISWLNGDSVRGWTSVMMVILLFGSIQLLVVGILGEYVGRLYIESKQRPIFLVSQIIRCSKKHVKGQNAGGPMTETYRLASSPGASASSK